MCFICLSVSVGCFRLQAVLVPTHGRRGDKRKTQRTHSGAFPHTLSSLASSPSYITESFYDCSIISSVFRGAGTVGPTPSNSGTGNLAVLISFSFFLSFFFFCTSIYWQFCEVVEAFALTGALLLRVCLCIC